MIPVGPRPFPQEGKKEGGRSPEEGTWELWFPPLGNAETIPYSKMPFVSLAMKQFMVYMLSLVMNGRALDQDETEKLMNILLEGCAALEESNGNA